MVQSLRDPQPPPADGERTFLASRQPPQASSVECCHFLVVVEGGGAGRRMELSDRPVVIGRSEACECSLSDLEVSKRHCEVRRANGQILVTDLGSTNGTFIDGRRAQGTEPWPPESLLQVGRHALRYELRSRKAQREAEQVQEDLRKASEYVQSILPRPLTDGPVEVVWRFVPSAFLGGDAFGYHWLDEGHFAIYLLDVCGHGTGAALLSVSAVNALRQGNLRDADFSRPGEVLASLNRIFQMDEHGEMYFTIWYGVYRLGDRRLSFASAGHPPALLAPAGERGTRELRTPNPGVGMLPDLAFKTAEVEVPPGSRLYLFSDGAYETVAADGTEGSFESFREIVTAGPDSSRIEPDRLLEAVYERSADRVLQDDVSILAARFS